MSDAMNLPELVRKSSAPLWRQIRKALGVKSREEAAELVADDSRAAKLVAKVLGAGATTGKPTPRTKSHPKIEI